METPLRAILKKGDQGADSGSAKTATMRKKYAENKSSAEKQLKEFRKLDISSDNSN